MKENGSLKFLDFVKLHLDKGSFPGLKWVRKEDLIFKLRWPKANKKLRPENLGIMYHWSIYKATKMKGKLDQKTPSEIKGNFRSVINSKKGKIIKLDEYKEDGYEWHIYQFKETEVDEAFDNVLNYLSCLNSKIGSKEIKKVQKDYREGNDDWKVYQFQQKPSAAQGTPVSPSQNSLLGWNFEPSVKIETMEESSLELKRGPTLKVLVNNQTYLPKSQLVKTDTVEESQMYKSPPRKDIMSPTSSPTYAPKVKPQLPVEPILRMQQARSPPFPGNMKLGLIDHTFSPPSLDTKAESPKIPKIGNTWSLSETEAKKLLDDVTLKAPPLLPPNVESVLNKHILNPDLFNDFKFLHNPNLHDILRGVWSRQHLIGDKDIKKEKEVEKRPVNAPPVSDTIPSFLDYIGKELEKLPYDCQERAKSEIFKVISDLKKQQSMFHLMIPHHWQLTAMARQQ